MDKTREQFETLVVILDKAYENPVTVVAVESAFSGIVNYLLAGYKGDDFEKTEINKDFVCEKNESYSLQFAQMLTLKKINPSIDIDSILFALNFTVDCVLEMKPPETERTTNTLAVYIKTLTAKLDQRKEQREKALKELQAATETLKASVEQMQAWKIRARSVLPVIPE